MQQQTYHVGGETAGATIAFIENILFGFRELVVSIEDENHELKSNLRNLSQRARQLRQQRQQQVSQSTSSSLTTNQSNNSNSQDGPSLTTTNTTSSATLPSSTATSSTKPPPYKSVVRIAPLPPARTKRKSNNRPSFGGNNTMGSRGALIVLEGLDRVGKSTLARRLVEHFQRTDRPVAYCRFPERSTPIGRLIDSFLKDNSTQVDDHVSHLLFSANRWELSNEIRNNILSGTTMVVDRYSYSGVAYSSAKATVPLEWCLATERGLPKPDLVIYLELPAEAQVGRSGYGEERFETTEFQERARRQYQHVMNKSQEIWLKIDVENKSPDQILGEIIVPVKRCLDSCANKSLDKLDFL